MADAEGFVRQNKGLVLAAAFVAGLLTAEKTRDAEWFSPEGEPRRYSFWAADSVYQLFLVTANKQFAVNLLPGLLENYAEWEQNRQDANGLFWQIDDRDGMEFSIGGSGHRPTINSYMYGDAVAIGRIADLAGQADVAKEYKAKADRLRQLIETQLWNPNDNFYETVPRNGQNNWSGVRELADGQVLTDTAGYPSGGPAPAKP